MTKRQQAPEGLKASTRARSSVQYKDRQILLSTLQMSLFILLTNGKRYSSHKIMNHLHTSDPRKEVQYLRRKGINVQDEWVEATPTTPRHKLYFIDPEESREEVGNE